jgi:hypothetical protein
MMNQYKKAKVRGTPSTMTRAAGRIEPRWTLVVVNAATMALTYNLHCVTSPVDSRPNES